MCLEIPATTLDNIVEPPEYPSKQKVSFSLSLERRVVYNGPEIV